MGLGTVPNADMASRLNRIRDILNTRAVGDVLSVIVEVAVVKMTNLLTCRTRADEGQGHQVMDVGALLAYSNTQAPTPTFSEGWRLSSWPNDAGAFLVDEPATEVRDRMHRLSLAGAVE